MKIAFILPSLKKVGPNIVALNIINNLIKDKNIEIAVYYIKPYIELEFPCETKKLTILNIKELYSFDIIHSHMLRPDIITALLPFYKGKKVTTIHNMVKDDLSYSYGKFVSMIVSKIWLFIWKKFNSNVVLTKIAKDYYIELGLSPYNIHVIYNGIKKTTIKSNEVPDEKEIIDFISTRKVIGTVCLFNERKGLDQIIKSLPKLEDHCFIVIGDGPIKANLYTLAENLNVQDKVLVLGFKKDPLSYFKFIDIYAMPSRSEGVPLALLEAIAQEKNTICSDISIFQELFHDNEINFFKLNDIDDCVRSIKNIDTQKKEQALKKLLSHYTDEIMARRYHDVYCEK